MANSEHMAILMHGFDVWHRWRAENEDIWPDLSESDLSRIDLKSANFWGTDLS